MAKFMLLIHGDHQEWADRSEEERRRIDEGHQRFSEIAGTAILGGHELAPADTATTLRARGGGAPEVTDGPFPEAKEILGGYYLIDVPDLDEAIRLAGLLPETAAQGSSGVEIRPVVDPA